MLDPKDCMDDDHQYVRGYIRRKEAYPKRRSWFREIAWYWRLFIFVVIFAGVIAILALSFTKHFFILFGLILFVFRLLFLRQSTFSISFYLESKLPRHCHRP